MSRIQFQGVTKRYRGVTVLDAVDLDVATGSFTVVCGPPRAGKSVLFRLLVGLEQPDAGRILFDGHDITQVPAAERTLGYVPQSFALFPHVSVFDNIAYPLVLQGVAKPEIARRVGQAAELLGIAPLLHARPAELSGGQKQRAAIARGILKDADIFILDDPLVGLDFKLRERLMDDLKAMRVELGATFLYATSDSLEALIVAQDLAVLDAGRLLQVGPVAEIYARPIHVRVAELVGFPRCNVLEGSVHAYHFSVAGLSIPIPDDIEQVALAAIRPEDVILAGPEQVHGTGVVTLIEDLGAEIVVYLRLEHDSLVTVLPAAAGLALEIGTRFPFAVRAGAAMIFDALTGERLGASSKETVDA